MREHDQRPAVVEPELGADRVLERGAPGASSARASVPTQITSGASTSASSRQSHGRQVRTIAADGRTSPPPGRLPGKHLATAAM